MSSRFGRNKRRAARERIAALEAELREVSRRMLMAERAVATAREDGATAVLQSRYLDQEIERMTHFLAKAYGPKLMEAARKVMAAEREPRRRMMDFRAVSDLSMSSVVETTTVEGSIPSLHYRVRIASL